MYLAQFEEKQAMLRYQTMNELWLQFLKEHNEMVVDMHNPKQPNTAPMLFCNNAPWGMRKAQDMGCLCKPCESFHLLRKGVTGACAAIEKLLERMRSKPDLSTGTRSQISVLKKIKDVIATPSKYDPVVKCLSLCLSTGKLEGTAHK